MTTVLVVDDVPGMAEQYAYDLKRLAGFGTFIAHSGRDALDLLEREAVDCMILDLEMPGMDGFEILRTMERRGLRVPVIVYTGTGNYDRCIQAIRLGAQGFIDKAEPMERVVREVENALERQRLAGQVAALRARLGETPLSGGSPAMQQLKDAIARVAKIPSPVLITGESGSGKELVARELHRLGANPKAPFVALNSAALPEHLVEDELFGHERGAFTGANVLRRGAFEAASGGGTLFLDEIGELPLAAQAKLLRVIEQREVTRIGGNRTIATDARVVAATNRDLEAEVAAGRFRQDLYYRLNVHALRVPPLRERLSDIPALAEQLLALTCARFAMRPKKLDAAALACLMAYDWRKNNVRELRNAVERMIIATDGDVIGGEDVPAEIRDATPAAGGRSGPAGTTFHALKAEAERQIIVAALARNEWHVTKTAEELGLADHASLLKIMRRHGITRE